MHREENSKSESRNSKEIRMAGTKKSSKQYDLEERAFQFAKDVRAFVKESISNGSWKPPAVQRVP